MTLARTNVGGLTATGSRDAVWFVPVSLGPNAFLLHIPGSLLLPTRPGTG
jgi:hypothetical protein